MAEGNASRGSIGGGEGGWMGGWEDGRMRKGQKIHDDGSGLGPWAVGHYECTTLVHVIERLQSAPTSAAAE